MTRDQMKYKATAKHVKSINVGSRLQRGGICL